MLIVSRRHPGKVFEELKSTQGMGSEDEREEVEQSEAASLPCLPQGLLAVTSASIQLWS